MFRTIVLISFYSALLHLALTKVVMIAASERILKEAQTFQARVESSNLYAPEPSLRPSYRFSFQSVAVKTMHFPAYLLACPRIVKKWTDDRAVCSLRTITWRIRCLNSLLIGVFLAAIWSVYRTASPVPPGAGIADGIESIPEVMSAGACDGMIFFRRFALDMPRRLATLLGLCMIHYFLTLYFSGYAVTGYGEIQSLFMRSFLSIMNTIFNAPLCFNRACLSHSPCQCSQLMNSAFCGSVVFLLREIFRYVRGR